MINRAAKLRFWKRGRRRRGRCLWKFNPDYAYWRSACGQSYEFFVGGPRENGIRFCPFCGRSVRVRDW